MLSIIPIEDTLSHIVCQIFFFLCTCRKYSPFKMPSSKKVFTILSKKKWDLGHLVFATKQLPTTVHLSFALKW